MSNLFSSYCYFLLWLIVLTVLLGIIGAFLPQFFSMLILMPYVIAFYLMTNRFLKHYHRLPDKKQRMQLSTGCATIFWCYSIVAGYIGLMLTQKTLTPDFSSLWLALHNQTFVIFLIGLFLCVNALLVGLGYWFLGKPAARMLEQQR
ncbi:hypothetical protein F4V57_00330 [Acinetobacter qingfengensis]|uniref:ABZJ_00895 family protein n=1 Tax=Acinetobacter qingfengensis TaxID=1262585 RepID=UPI00114CF2BC|nr:ABZJ_00895 family protein [Acinetobacter qingfengensis]KAA8735285.1 hypothetical protein F4V57_00330 [Acinetobacter qingfengensis]